MPAERNHGASVRRIGSRIGVAAVISLIAGLAPALPTNAATDDPVPVSVAIIVPITAALTDPDVVYPSGESAPAVAPTLIDAPTLEAYTSPEGILSTRLAAVAGSSATLAIDPRLIASIRALGSAAPTSATEWLARLDAAPNDTIELPWGGGDVTAPLQAGRTMVVRPSSLEFAIDPTRFAAAEGGASSDPTIAPPLPDTAELLRWDYTVPNVIWPTANAVTAKDVDKFVRSGYTGVILTDDNARRRSTTRAVATIGDTRAYVSDTELETELASAISALDEPTWDATSAALAAALPSGGATTLLTLHDQDWDGGRMPATLARISSTPGVTIAGLGSFAALEEAPRATLIDEAHDPARVARVKQLLVSESLVSRFATIVEEPALIRGERRVRLLNTLAVAPAEWPVAAADNLAEAEKILSSVSVKRGSDINAFADYGNIPVTIRNDLSQAVTLHLALEALNPNLTIDSGDIEVVVERSSQESVPVPYTAVSNGRVTLSAQLRGDDGLAIGGPVYITTHVQAGWEGPVSLIGGVLAGLVFAAGIVRTALKRRRARSADATSDD